MSTLESIARSVRACTRCRLHRSRTHAVPGEGPATATAMLVGEAPGAAEDAHGRPFAGRAGSVLDEALKAAGLQREQLFITSIVKCRPPDNRLPRRDEWETCIGAHLQRQLAVVQPKIVCLLGGVAAQALLGDGRVGRLRGRLLVRGYTYFVTYHPAAAGRNPVWRTCLVQDLQKLRTHIEEATH